MEERGAIDRGADLGREQIACPREERHRDPGRAVRGAARVGAHAQASIDALGTGRNAGMTAPQPRRPAMITRTISARCRAWLPTLVAS